MYVAKAIRSVLLQTAPIFEIIVSNDCSTDGTRRVLDSLTNEIPILKCIHQNQNLGISKNVKSCMEMAKGDYIIRLDSDDILRPEFAEKLSAQLLLFPSAGYAHAAVQQIDQDGNFGNIRNLSRPSGYQDGNTALKNATKGFKVAANIIIYRKEALEKVRYSVPSSDFAEDYYLVTSLSSAGFGNVYLNEVLAEYRVWVDSGNVRKKRKLEEISGLNNLITDLLEPAFNIRNWPKKPIVKMRKSLAIRHSDCLAWKSYSKSEKTALKYAIYQLYPSRMVKVIAYMYLNGFGFIIESNKFLAKRFKLALKTIYLNYHKLFSIYF